MAPLRDAAIKLPDGRRLAYAEWGDPEGSPVLFFHGSPHSRLWCPDESATVSNRVRLITVDRPGIGGSDILPARTFAEWPGHVTALADSLGIARFAVVGWSGGGPSAAACGALIAPRVTSVGVVSSRHLARYNFAERPEAYAELDPDDRAEFDLAQHDPTAAGELAAVHTAKMVANLQEHPEIIHSAATTAEGDRWFFAGEARAKAFDAAIREALRQGTNGYRWEVIDSWFPWGFRLADIATPVYVWHGAQDTRVTQADIDFIASRIRDCTVTVWPDAGHLGIAKHWDEILKLLTREQHRRRIST